MHCVVGVIFDGGTSQPALSGIARMLLFTCVVSSHQSVPIHSIISRHYSAFSYQ